MSKGKILTFEELLEGKKLKMSAIPNDRAQAARKYWEERENGTTYGKYINLFKKRYEDTPLSLLETLTYMNMYMLEKDAKTCSSENGIIFNETSFAYAEFYEWITDEFLEREDVESLITFNFNGEMPPCVQYGGVVCSELYTYRISMEYDELPKESAIRKIGDSIISYINAKTDTMCMLSFIDKEGNQLMADQAAFFKGMPKDTKDYMHRIIKANILQIAEAFGNIFFVYLDGEVLYTNGFAFNDGKFQVMSPEDIEKAIEDIVASGVSNASLESVVQAVQLGRLESASIELK